MEAIIPTDLQKLAIKLARISGISAHWVVGGVALPMALFFLEDFK